MADLTIVVDVRQLETGEWQTMSSYKVPRSGKITFTNASKTDSLKISGKEAFPALKLCELNGTEIVLPLEVPKEDSRVVKICDSFTEPEFLYTAKIGDALEEDPIVIIEKKSNIVFDTASFVFGAAIAAAVTYLVMKALARKMRPQQG
jgi:hypothetical protein